jgi:hypothetical protein
MANYWKMRKDFLDYFEDSVTQDSLIGSTINTRSKKTVSSAGEISSPSVVSENTKVSKASEKSNARYFYPKNLIMHLCQSLILMDTGMMSKRLMKMIHIR